MLCLQEDYHGMVDLASCSSIDRAGNTANTVKAKALKSKSPKGKRLSKESPVQLSSLAQFG